VLHLVEVVVVVLLLEEEVVEVLLSQEVVEGVEVHPLEEVGAEDHLLMEVVGEVEDLLLMEEVGEVEHQVVEVVVVALLLWKVGEGEEGHL